MAQKCTVDLSPDFVERVNRIVHARSRGAGLSREDRDEITQNMILAALRAAGQDQPACEGIIIENTRRGSYYDRMRKAVLLTRSPLPLDDSATPVVSRSVLPGSGGEDFDDRRRPGTLHADPNCGCEDYDEVEHTMMLQSALTKVRPECALGWRMVRIDGASIAEAAVALKCSYGTAYNMIVRTDAVVRNEYQVVHAA